MSEFHQKAARNRFRIPLIAGGLFALALWGGPFNAALAQTIAPVPACLSKTDETGGRMRFIVLEEDVLRFEQAGFQRFACPALTPEIAQGQKDRCDRLRQETPEGQDAIAGLYGLAVADMCRATDAWVQSQAAQ